MVVWILLMKDIVIDMRYVYLSSVIHCWSLYCIVAVRIIAVDKAGYKILLL